MSQLRKFSDTHVRVVCDCGEYVHDVFQDENGDIAMESYSVKPKGKKSDERETEVPATVPPKPERRTGLFAKKGA